MRLAVCVLAAWPGLASAHDWMPLDGGGIADLLSGHGAVFDGVMQRFNADGSTVLNVSPPRSGRWRVRGDKYCTSFPPEDTWVCYAVHSIHGEIVRFVGPGGDGVEGAMVP